MGTTKEIALRLMIEKRIRKDKLMFIAFYNVENWHSCYHEVKTVKVILVT